MLTRHLLFTPFAIPTAAGVAVTSGAVDGLETLVTLPELVAGR